MPPPPAPAPRPIAPAQDPCSRPPPRRDMALMGRLVMPLRHHPKLRLEGSRHLLCAPGAAIPTVLATPGLETKRMSHARGSASIINQRGNWRAAPAPPPSLSLPAIRRAPEPSPCLPRWGTTSSPRDVWPEPSGVLVPRAYSPGLSAETSPGQQYLTPPKK